MTLSIRIRSYIDGPEAERLLYKYYDREYTGRFYDELRDRDPDRITADDVAAVALLSVPLSGKAVKALLWTRAEQLAALLKATPKAALHEIESEDELEPLWRVQEFFRTDVRNVGIGHVRRSKLLARKRPHLVPIRDQYVLKALVGGTQQPLTLPLRAALREDRQIVERLGELRDAVDRQSLSLLRVLDVVVWMSEVGDAQVSD